MKVVDAGANIGPYSILAAKLVGPTGTVWSFEPAPETFARLERNLSSNGCDHVQRFRLALSDVPTSFCRSTATAGSGTRIGIWRTAPPRPTQTTPARLWSRSRHWTSGLHAVAPMMSIF
jgi:FkbM family methyltransferase